MVLQSIRENEPRTRAIGYPIERYKIVRVMLSGLFAGAGRRALCDPEQVCRAPISCSFWSPARFVIFNVIGGIGTLVGPIVGAAFLSAVARGAVALLHRILPDLGRHHLHREW